jgi:zinc transporter 1/2/3
MDTTAAIGIAVRQVAAATVAAAPSDLATAASPLAPACSSGNDYDGHVGVRISAIFVILIGSLFGAVQSSNAASI